MIRRHVHLDAVGGIAGDMFVAAMLDALPELTGRVMGDVDAVLPPDVGRARLVDGLSAGIRVRRLVWQGEPDHVDEPAHGHDHPHAHEAAHGSTHERGHTHGHDHVHGDHPHGDHAADSGTFAEMRARIAAAPLSAGTAEQAIGILTALAEAEAHVHRMPVEDVHFHEIADWDSLLDVVAAGSLIAALGDASWSVSELPLGGGTVKTRHGLMPVPAPATARLLEGFAWRDDGVGGERVTPTGAAILRHLRAGWQRPGGRLAATGTGAGTRELPGMPNILRAMVTEVTEAVEAPADETVAELAFDIDDMTGEEIASAAQRLREIDGVLDLSLVSLMGKKGRPFSGFRLLVRPDALDDVAARCLVETSTIGLRWHMVSRRRLGRAARSVATDEGRLRLKEVVRPDGRVTRKAESDDLAARTLGERREIKRRIEDEPDER
ncbi:LarC family nickel insertion protein [Ancylobacter mangrovi]|uniref:LarC family nickel insertion protein n=1 Tax=Ancylobacter mangrovi TaxID=2972472 RepID=UPI002163F4C5|nr:LarC family nickel insertion protein [Ancylobacter mangrovi]MCS0500859.1 LarC family nickel insertion protein [Ancylobacter mangrovi]